ncbi:MAG: UbiA family prenyltransferase [archaeon]
MTQQAPKLSGGSGIVQGVLFGMLRVQRTQTTVASSISGMILSGVWDSRIILLGLAVFLFHASAGALNDIADFEVDRVNSPSRPLVKGTIGIWHAKLIVAVLVVLALLVAWFLDPWLFLLAATVGMALEILYNYVLKLKNNSLGSFLYLSASVSPVPFLVGTFVSGNLTIKAFSFALPLLVLSNCIVLGSFKDFEGDKQMGKRTFVVAFGKDKAKKIMAALLVGSIIAYVAPVVFFNFSTILLLLAIPLGIARCALAYALVRDIFPQKAGRMVVAARILIVLDHVSLILTRPPNGI